MFNLLGISIHPLPLIGALVLLWAPCFIPSDLRRRLTDPTRLSIPTFLGMVRVWTNWLDLVRAAAGAYLLAHLAFSAVDAPKGTGSNNTPSTAPTNALTPPASDPDKATPSPSTATPDNGDTNRATSLARTNTAPPDTGSADKAPPPPPPPPKKGPSPKTLLMLLQFAVLAVGLLLQTVRVRRGVTTLFAPTFYVCGLTLAHADPVIGVAAVAVGWLIALAAKSPIYQLPVMVVALGVAGFLLSNMSLLMYCGVALLPIILGLLWQKRLVYVSHGRSALHKG